MARPLPADAFPSAAFHVNTASVGIPPLASIAALHRYADAMASGICDTATYAAHVERCRAAFDACGPSRSTFTATFRRVDCCTAS